MTFLEQHEILISMKCHLTTDPCLVDQKID